MNLTRTGNSGRRRADKVHDKKKGKKGKKKKKKTKKKKKKKKEKIRKDDDRSHLIICVGGVSSTLNTCMKG